MELSGASSNTLFGALVDLVKRERVRAGGIRVAAKSAEPAVRDAHVGGVDVAVDVEIAGVTVTLFTHIIREPADGQQVRRSVEHNPIVEAQPLTGQNFVGDRLQACVPYTQIA